MLIGQSMLDVARIQPMPTRRERRTIRPGDVLQKANYVLNKPLAWTDISRLDNGTDSRAAILLCKQAATSFSDGTSNIVYRVVGLRDGRRYVVHGFGDVGKPA